MSWNTLESDPGVFTHLLEALAPNSRLDIVELWALEREAYPLPTHALLFLFKWQGKGAQSTSPPEHGSSAPLFFKQTIGNACGTIALLHCISNMPGVVLKPEIAAFMDFAKELDPASRGDALEQNDSIRVTHNSFARPEPFVHEKDDDDEDPDAFHFIAFIPHNGQVYELDGLQQGPKCLGQPKDGQDWLDVASAALQERIAAYAASEIRFNLLAITDDARPGLRQRLGCLRSDLDALYGCALSLGDVPGDVLDPEQAMQDAGAPQGIEAVEGQSSLAQPLPSTAAGISQAYDRVLSRVREVSLQLQDEEGKHGRYAVENARRKHNFVPFVMEMLHELARRGQLMPLYEAGRKKQAEQRQRAMAAGKGQA